MTTTAENSTINEAEELATLRTTNKELLAKLHERKARIEELEAAAVTMQAQVAAAETARHDALVGIPLRRLAEEMSEVPSLFMSEFLKRYKVEAGNDGKLIVQTLDGRPIKDKQDAPIEANKSSLWNLLTGGATNYAKNEDSKIFATITKWCGPSGAGANGNRASDPRPSPSTAVKEKPAQKLNLGLR